MDIVRPLTVTPDMVTTDAVDAYPAYDPVETYDSGDQVTYLRRTYLSLQPGNSGKTPGETTSAEWWSDAGPSNTWAMFDGEIATVTARADTLTVIVEPLGAPTIGLLNVRAKTAHCTSVFDGTLVYDKEIVLWDTSVIGDWGEYFFNEPEFRTEAIFEGLLGIPGQVVTVFLDATGSTAQCGMFIPGKPFDTGIEIVGLKRSGEDFSTVTFSEFGGPPTIKRRGYARQISTQTLLPNSALDRIARRLDQIASVPVLVLSGQPRFTSTVTYGLVSYSIDVPLQTHSYASFEVKGFT